ncbi:cell surface protein [Lactiplantibacillus sp. DA1]|uniref:cell surface protein n=1 Tax=Lactiplantibacillus sp. DA1 TaxID=3079857 RepID=UPI00292A5EC2|nr:cell surface protein [Lactiplantibacillus sp. DA1]MDV0432033.1 cell surface protein [Lactiplantibacillus sp. DA1]
MVKRFLLQFCIAMVSLVGFCFLSVNFQIVKASITVSGNSYTVTSGDDLFNLLANTSSYWSSSNTPPENMTIKVDNPVTLPSSNSTLYSGLKNVIVDFQQHQFYVASPIASRILVPKTSSAQLTLSNVNNTSNSTSNTVSNVPRPSGDGVGSYYYNTYFGMLFSADFGLSLGTTNCSAQITYNNVVYNMPNSVDYSQPLTTYFVPINFTGTNTINTSVGGQQLGEIPNIKVSSGTTTLNGGNGSAKFDGAMIYPYYNNLNGKSFPIEISSGATLDLKNKDTRVPMFAFIGTNNAVTIDNNGTLNITSTSTNSPTTLFGSGTNGVTFNSNDGSKTNIKTGSAAFSSKMSTVKLVGNFANTSSTVIASTDSSPLYNSSSWGNNSLITVNAGAKLATYSGGDNSGGLTNKGGTIPFNFVGGSTSQGYTSTDVPSDADSYLALTPNDSIFNTSGSIVDSDKLTAITDKAMLISSQLIGTELGSGTYTWDYGLDKLASSSQYLSRTSGDVVNFRVIDTRAAKPNFSIMASYTEKQLRQPFTMWFKNGSTETQLSTNAQTILSSNTMSVNNSVYTATFDSDSGLLIKANNKAKSGSFSGVVDWTLSNGL